MLLAGMGRLHRDVERMGLDHGAVADKVIAFRAEREPVHPAAEARELDGSTHFAGRHGLAVPIGIEMELWRHAGLEDGDLESEITAAQQAAAVRATLVVRRLGRLAVPAGRAVLVGRVMAATPGEQRDEREGDSKGM